MMFKAKWNFWLAGFLFCLIHLRTLGFGLVWDDVGALQKNPIFDGPLIGAIFKTQMQHVGINPGQLNGITVNSDSFRPLLNLQFWIEHYLFGWNSVALHFFSLFWMVVLIITSHYVFSAVLGASRFFIIFLAVHPLLIEPATYVAARSDTMSAVFAVLMIGCCIQALSDTRRYGLWLALSIISFFSAVGFKEGVVLTPLAAMFLTMSAKRNRRFWGLYIGLGLAMTVYVVLRMLAATTAAKGFTIDSILYWPNHWLDYAVQLIAPFEISTERVPSGFSALWGWLIVGLGFALCYLKAWLRFYLPVLASLIVLWPSTLAIQVFDILADRYFLLSAIILLAVVSSILRHKVFNAALVAVWTLISLSAVRAWESERTLYLNAVQKSGTSSAYFRLATTVPWAEAVPFFQLAVTLDPRSSKAWNALGVAYLQLGQFEKAEEILKKAIEIPSDVAINAWANLGIAQWQLKKPKEACTSFKTALTIDPFYKFARGAYEDYCTNSKNPVRQGPNRQP